MKNKLTKELTKKAIFCYIRSLLKSPFVHAGRASAYPVATLEAMRAGLPVVVTDMTGTKDIVERVVGEVKRSGLNCEFVRPLNKIYKGIIDYFRIDVEVRKRMSELYRKESKQFEPSRRAKDFKEKFD